MADSSHGGSAALIYTSVGLNAHYAECLRYLWESLVAYNKRATFEFMVMCDSATERTVRAMAKGWPFPVHVAKVPDAPTPQLASMQKLRVFHWAQAGRFSKVLFLDADILVTLDIGEFLNQPIRDDCFYACKETTDKQLHQNIHFSLYDTEKKCIYTADELKFFSEREIYPFNAGMFLMLNTPAMRAHFQRVLQLVNSHKGYYFYEQSYLNHYFNRLGKVDYSLITSENYVMHPRVDALYTGKVIHFTGGVGDGLTKAKVMERYLRRMFSRSIPFATREQMVKRLISPGAQLAEIGTLKGDFAQSLLGLQPSRLHLVDTFNGPIGSGDVDGNGFQLYDGGELERFVRERYRGDGRVAIHKCSSKEFLSRIPDGSLDAVYIDADHSYEGCLSDLELARPKVRHGGFIMGHDYEMNPARAKVTYQFGVKAAVDEFCSRHGVRIHAKAWDGYVSYCVINP
jgi:hypothetical protein